MVFTREDEIFMGELLVSGRETPGELVPQKPSEQFLPPETVQWLALILMEPSFLGEWIEFLWILPLHKLPIWL